MSSSGSRSTRGRRRRANASQQSSVDPNSTDLFATGTPQTDVEMGEAQSNVSRRQHDVDEHSDAVSLVSS